MKKLWARWVNVISAYNLRMHHRPNSNKIIKIADGMSRLNVNLQDTPMFPLTGEEDPEFDMAPFHDVAPPRHGTGETHRRA